MDATANSATITGERSFADERTNRYLDNEATVSGLLSPEDAPAFAQLMFVTDESANRPGLTLARHDRLTPAWAREPGAHQRVSVHHDA